MRWFLAFYAAVVALAGAGAGPVAVRDESIDVSFGDAVVRALGYPEVAIRVGSDGIEVPATLAAGRYLVSLRAEAPSVGYLDLVRPPAGLSEAEATELALAAARDDLAQPGWVYAGGHQHVRSRRGAVVRDRPGAGRAPDRRLVLPAGAGVGGDHAAGAADGDRAGDGGEPGDDADGGSGGDAGRERAAGDGDAGDDRRAAIRGFPGLGAGRAAAVEADEHGPARGAPRGDDTPPGGGDVGPDRGGVLVTDGGTPPAGEPLVAHFTFVGYAALQSGGQTTWVGFDLAPATDAATCSIVDPATGRPHALDGMATVFTVA